jgi:hypothetical protein
MPDRSAVTIEHEGKPAPEGSFDAECSDLLMETLQGEVRAVRRQLQKTDELAPQPFEFTALPVKDGSEQSARTRAEANRGSKTAWRSGEFTEQLFQILLAFNHAASQEGPAGDRRLSYALDLVLLLLDTGSGIPQDLVSPTLQKLELLADTAINDFPDRMVVKHDIVGSLTNQVEHQPDSFARSVRRSPGHLIEQGVVRGMTQSRDDRYRKGADQPGDVVEDEGC